MLRELNNEAVLLMYLADELPGDDRAEVDRMLRADVRMREELARLQSAIEAFEAGMKSIDSHPLASESAALRRIGLAMRQHVVEAAKVSATPGARPPAMTPRYPWWMYPAIGAAAVLVIMVSWWGSRPSDPMMISPLNPSHNPQGDPGKSSVATDEAEPIEGLDNPNPTIPEKTVASLKALQDQVAEIEISRSQPNPFAGDDSE